MPRRVAKGTGSLVPVRVEAAAPGDVTHGAASSHAVSDRGANAQEQLAALQLAEFRLKDDAALAKAYTEWKSQREGVTRKLLKKYLTYAETADTTKALMATLGMSKWDPMVAAEKWAEKEWAEMEARGFRRMHGSNEADIQAMWAKGVADTNTAVGQAIKEIEDSSNGVITGRVLNNLVTALAGSFAPRAP